MLFCTICVIRTLTSFLESSVPDLKYYFLRIQLFRLFRIRVKIKLLKNTKKITDHLEVLSVGLLYYFHLLFK